MPAQESFRTYRPLIALGGLTVFAPLIEGGTTHLPVLIIRLILFGSFIAWLARAMQSGRIAIHRTRLYAVMAVFGGWAVLSVVRSPYTAPGVQWLISLSSYTLMFFLVVELVDSIRQVRGLVMVLLSMGLLEAALGMYQYVWDIKARPTGTFFNANFFATYEVAILAVAFGLLCFRRGDEGGRGETLLLKLTAVTAPLAVLFAQSRGAILALGAALGFVGVSRFGKFFLGVLAIVLVAVIVVPNPLQQRIRTVEAENPYSLARLQIWKSSLQRIADHPWGAGLGLYKYLSFRYRFPVEEGPSRYAKRAESAHSEYLQMAVELGVVGLVIFLTGLAFVFGRDFREALTGRPDCWDQGLIIGLAGGIIGILVHAAVDSVFHEPALVLLLVLFVGMIVVLKRLHMPGGVPMWEMPFPFHPVRAGLVGVMAVLFLALIIQPAAAWYVYERGESEAAVGDNKVALIWLQRAARIDPGTATYRDALALLDVRLYHQSGDPRWLLQAVEELKTGLELNPLDGRFANRLGTLYVLLAARADADESRAAFLNQAVAAYEQAIRLEPVSPYNYLELGKIRLAQGRPDEAQAWFRRAISYEPNFLPARVHLAELALRNGQKQIAGEEYAEIVRIQERFRGRVLAPYERPYLEVDDVSLKRAFGQVSVP